MQRISQHRNANGPKFTSRYDCKLLVYYEPYEDMPNAITREKQIKAGSRAKKISLIEKNNPAWADLFESLM